MTLRGPTLAKDFQAIVQDYIEKNYGRAPARRRRVAATNGFAGRFGNRPSNSVLSLSATC